MKRLLILAAMLTASQAWAQGRARFGVSASDPANPCDPVAFWVNSSSGALFYCTNGTWQATAPPMGATNITTGTIDPARLGSGATGTKFLRGEVAIANAITIQAGSWCRYNAY